MKLKVEPRENQEQFTREFEQVMIDAIKSGALHKDEVRDILEKLMNIPRPIFPELLLKRPYGE